MLNWIRSIFAGAPKARAKQSGTTPVMQAMLEDIRRKQMATYDAARTSDEHKNYWANADRYDADSANSREVRAILVPRSRYEIGNNGYSDGIAQTYSTDLIGNAPTLRMQTGSDGFNKMVELEWYRWCKAVKLRRKLWTMAHAKHSDGEAFAVVRQNRKIKHAVKLDVVLHETEQCQTPYTRLEAGKIDGITFDEFGNTDSYEFLKEHPGKTNAINPFGSTESVPANRVLHWFKLRRPGQHRGIPEMTSTLNMGAGSRRWREANLSAAERAALLTLMMKTQMSPEEIERVAPFSVMDVEKGMMNFLPEGWDLFQAEGKFPTATYESFHKSNLNEQARPKSMPYNKAACDSSSYNYASGRLDHQTYYAALDVEREDCNDLVLDTLFEVWFDYAVMVFNWLGGNPEAIGPAGREHIWDWPKHKVADVESEANANETKLTSGQIFIHRLFSEAGLDLEDECVAGAASLGVPLEEFKRRLFDIVMPPVSLGGTGQPPPNSTTSPAVDNAVAAMFEKIAGRMKNGNGAHSHAN
jgi:capsid protein